MSKTEPPSQFESLAFASELIKARNHVGITQSELSAQSQVSLSAIKGYETGRNVPGSRELREICRVLRVTPNKLLFGEEHPFTPTEADGNGKTAGDKGLEIQRSRIALLVDLLSFNESSAIYTLVHSIAVARHGAKVVNGHLAASDFITSMMRLNHRKGVDIDLLPKDPELLEQLILMLNYAKEFGKANGCETGMEMGIKELIEKVTKK